MFGRILICLSCWTLAIGIPTWGLPTAASGQPPLLSPMAGESLSGTLLTLSIDDQNADKLLRQVLSSVPGRRPAGGPNRAGVDAAASLRSVWIDRHVDTGIPVRLTLVATPASQIVLKIASDADWAVFPLPGVLLVGRPAWVDATIDHLCPSAGAEERITVRWPTGSTAGEVLNQILSATPGRARAAIPPAQPAASSWLPHDVWPGGELIEVDRTLAVSLVLAQFEMGMKRGTPLKTLAALKPLASGVPGGVQVWSAMAPAKPFPLTYPAGDSEGLIRDLLKQKQPRSTIRTTDGKLLVLTTATNHREAIAAIWAAGKRPADKKRPGQDLVFDLKLVNKPVAEVLGQLAAADNRRFRIEPEAGLASEQLVSLDAKQETLPKLGEMVAAIVGLRVVWGEDEVVVTKPEK